VAYIYCNGNEGLANWFVSLIRSSITIHIVLERSGIILLGVQRVITPSKRPSRPMPVLRRPNVIAIAESGEASIKRA
jgi:hypothetical protein